MKRILLLISVGLSNLVYCQIIEVESVYIPSIDSSIVAVPLSSSSQVYQVLEVRQGRNGGVGDKQYPGEYKGTKSGSGSTIVLDCDPRVDAICFETRNSSLKEVGYQGVLLNDPTGTYIIGESLEFGQESVVIHGVKAKFSIGDPSALFAHYTNNLLPAGPPQRQMLGILSHIETRDNGQTYYIQCIFDPREICFTIF